jgi:hypothetical protein
MPILAGALGCCVLALVLVDGFNTIVLARRTHHMFRIARAFYRYTWRAYAALSRRIQSGARRESLLSVYGPLSLLTLVTLWAAGLILAFGLLQWAVKMQPASLRGSFGNDLYLSGAALFTMSTGDPGNTISKFLCVVEGGLGAGFLGLMIAYLPVLYQSFSQRELQISLVDARAGSPPSASELLLHEACKPATLERELQEWERWEAQLLENHLSFPMLAYFRSQHSTQSWLTALIAMLDSTAVIILCSSDDVKAQAELTFGMGRHVLADVSKIFRLDPAVPAEDRLPSGEFLRLVQALAGQSLAFQADRLSESELKGLRASYEPLAAATSRHFMMALPKWIADNADRNVNARGTGEIPFAASDPFRKNPA